MLLLWSSERGVKTLEAAYDVVTLFAIELASRAITIGVLLLATTIAAVVAPTTTAAAATTTSAAVEATVTTACGRVR